MILFDAFGYFSILKVMGNLENGPTMLAVLKGIHRAVFYFEPTYYDFPRRLTNVKYVSLK